MEDSFRAQNYNDQNGNPAGGYVSGIGLSIIWQDGPLGRSGERQSPNGAFVETVIAAAIQRLKYYQDSKFSSEYNSIAISQLELALDSLKARTADREIRQVEGTHAV
jgi:hypothetical protein